MAGTEEKLSYRELEESANRTAHCLKALGLKRGDVVAVMLLNEVAVFEIAWGAQRAGIYLTSISNKLTAQDVSYIVKDSGAKVLIVSVALAQLAADALSDLRDVKGFCTSTASHGLQDWGAEQCGYPSTRREDESAGTDMLYSSGTTGRPKGVRPDLPAGPIDAPTPLTQMGSQLYGMDEDTIYLSASPLYHAAPLRWAMTVQRLGGTVVIMDRFDAETALALIERFGITHSTWVPTHFIRMLKLPGEVRKRYDVSSQKAAVHAAAPCPVPIKRDMIDWWGPIIHEYYAGTESCGITAISAQEWLARPGSVGKAVLGKVKIVGEDGTELPSGREGQVYFADGPTFTYHNDPEKTAAAHNEKGWATIGDIGRIDDQGYLFLTDRKNFMIISGGVNIYPQEIENRLVTHPDVTDVAVIGLPDDEMGEIVTAVVQPAPGSTGDEQLTERLRQFAREALGAVKTPRRFIFREDLPREPTGKMMKRKLIDEYSSAETSGNA